MDSSPVGICREVASENTARIARVLSTGPIAVTLSATAVVRTRVFVVVASGVGSDVRTVDVLARVG